MKVKSGIETLEILEPGLLTTIQDRGRYGYQRYGVPVSGAMDTFAFRAANRLVGNDDSSACLEITVMGPKVRFLTDTWFAVCGADLSAVLDNRPIERWRTIEAPAGSVLGFGSAKDGMRAYLAVPGGIDVPLVMGSRSTYPKAGIGGCEGRALKAGDVLRVPASDSDAEFVRRRLAKGMEAPEYGHHHQVRVVMGPQDGAFTAAGVATLVGADYKVSIQSDRMGCRLDGPTIEHTSGPDIVSDGTPLGAVQVPGNGLPIILMADRGTTGGYTKIATVISTDVSRLGQAMPGDTLSFTAVTLDEAQKVLLEQESVLEAIENAEAAFVGLRVLLDGEAFEVTDDTGKRLSQSDPVEIESNGASQRVRATIDDQSFEFDVSVSRMKED